MSGCVGKERGEQSVRKERIINECEAEEQDVRARRNGCDAMRRLVRRMGAWGVMVVD